MSAAASKACRDCAQRADLNCANCDGAGVVWCSRSGTLSASGIRRLAAGRQGP